MESKRMVQTSEGDFDLSVIFTFPGQGSQRAGMLHRLPDHSEVTRTLAEASEVLGRNAFDLDNSDAFLSSMTVQLCLLIAGVAMARTLMASGGRPDMAAGLSIGAYPAAVVSGALAFPDAISLVAKRGKLMEDAFPTGYGMAAIVGLCRRQVEELISQVHSETTPVYLANLNAAQQFVVAGANDALQAVVESAISCGASKSERLAISVPSHCELLENASDQMRAAIASVEVHRPDLPYLSSSMARRLVDPERIRDDLAGNMARRVHWSDTSRLAYERGARLAVEMPSGSVLTNLTAPVFVEGQAICCDGNSFDTVLTLIKQARLSRPD